MGRLKYIDAVKGFVIFCVIWLHTWCHPEWCSMMFVDTLFFMIAGMFYRERPSLKEHLLTDLRRIAVPAIVFYFGSIPILLVMRYLDYGTISGYLNVWIFDPIRFRHDSWYPLNFTIWFLAALFWIRLYWRYIIKLPKWILLTMIGLMIFGIGNEVVCLDLPLMIGHAMYWWIWFAIGALGGPYLFKINATLRGSLITFVCALAFCFITVWLMPLINNDTFSTLCLNGRYIPYLIILTSFLSAAEKLIEVRKIPALIFTALSWMGANSIVFMVLHFNMNEAVRRCLINIPAISKLSDPTFGFVISVIVTLLIVPTVPLINRYLPETIGKKRPAKSQLEPAAEA